jgi:thiamine-monophosphate kinase
VLTTDAQVEGVHFDRRFVPPDAIGHRALAVNLSDLAAMGACPRAALLSLMLPGDFPMEAVDGILDGLLTLADRHRVAVIGGNVTRSPGPVVIDVTAIGTVRPRRVLVRAGARPGDEVRDRRNGGAVVGCANCGDDRRCRRTFTWQADLKVRLCFAGMLSAADLRSASLPAFKLRVRAGPLLGRARGHRLHGPQRGPPTASGMRRLPGVGMVIDASALPIGESVRAYHHARGSDPVDAVLTGGDDYELIFTIRPTHRRRLRAVTQLVGDLPITKVGTVTRDRRVVVRTPQGDRDLPAGFEHFR